MVGCLVCIPPSGGDTHTHFSVGFLPYRLRSGTYREPSEPGCCGSPDAGWVNSVCFHFAGPLSSNGVRSAFARCKLGPASSLGVQLALGGQMSALRPLSPFAFRWRPASQPVCHPPASSPGHGHHPEIILLLCHSINPTQPEDMGQGIMTVFSTLPAQGPANFYTAQAIRDWWFIIIITYLLAGP